MMNKVKDKLSIMRNNTMIKMINKLNEMIYGVMKEL